MSFVSFIIMWQHITAYLHNLVHFALELMEKKTPGSRAIVLRKMTQKCTDLFHKRKDLREQ